MYEEENGKGLELNFRELGLETTFVKAITSDVGTTFLFDLKYISNYNKKYLKSLAEKLSVYYHEHLEIVDSNEAHFGLFWKAPPTKLSLAQLLKRVNQREMVIGEDTLGNLVKLDFEKIPHLLIAGATGSGKSVLIHNILTNIMSYYCTTNDKQRFRKKVELFIIDPKGNELSMYRNMNNTTFVDTPQRAIDILKAMVVEMDKVYLDNRQLEQDIYVIIDELADLMLRSKFEVEESIVRLAQKGRAIGIHLIIATQRPSVDVVSGLIKANMPYRICLKTASIRDSIVVMDSKLACDLDIGEAIFHQGVINTRFKVAYPENEVESRFIQCNMRG